jgi:hypothetical protein
MDDDHHAAPHPECPELFHEQVFIEFPHRAGSFPG